MRPKPDCTSSKIKQQAVLVGQFPQAGQETLRRDSYAAFALDGFDHQGGGFIVDQFRHGVQVAEWGVDKAGHQGSQAFVILGLGRGRGRSHRAAVKSALEGDDFVSRSL